MTPLRSIAFCLAFLSCLFAGCASKGLTAHQRQIIQRHESASAPAATGGNAGVWEIAGAHNTVYLAATAHLITADQLPFPAAFYDAYRDSAELYMEVDPDPSALARLRFLAKTARWIAARRGELLLPRGQTLADHLEPQLVARLREHYGSDFKRRERFSPLLLAFVAEAEAMVRQSENHGGVEDAFAAFAARDRKPIRALDDRSVEDVAFRALDQMLLALRAEMNVRGADLVLAEKVFPEHAEVREASWLTGDLEAASAIVREMAEESPTLFQQLGPERNRKWLPKIQRALQAKHNVMILAGVAHFAGPDNILDLLRAAGYQPRQLPAAGLAAFRQ